MIKTLLNLLSLTCFCFLTSCAGSKTVEEKIEEPLQDRMVARVASVNAEEKYVLIQRFGKLEIPDDSILYTIASEATEGHSAASIKVTGERLGQFLAADIITGELSVGDAVYLRTFEIKKLSDDQETLNN